MGDHYSSIGHPRVTQCVPSNTWLALVQVKIRSLVRPLYTNIYRLMTTRYHEFRELSYNNRVIFLLYVFVPVRTPPPESSPPPPPAELILINFPRHIDLELSRSIMTKVVRLPRNENQTYRLNARPEMRAMGLTSAMTLTLNFQGQICYI